MRPHPCGPRSGGDARRRRHRAALGSVLAVAGLLVGHGSGMLAQDVPSAQLPPGLQPDRELAGPAATGSAQAEEAVRRHRELGMRIAGLRQEADRLGTQSKTLLGALRRLEVERELQTSRAEQAEGSLSLITKDIDALEHRIGDLDRAQARELPSVIARLQRLQRLGHVGYARIVWGTSSAQQLGRAARMMTHMAREDADRLVRYRDITAQLTSADARLQSRRAEAVELQQSAAALLAAAARATAEHRQLLSRIAGERDEQLRVVAELERARLALDGTVAAYRPASPVGATAGPGHAATVALDSLKRSLPWPAHGPIAQRFGRRRDPRFGTIVVRSGIDITAATGTAVQAIHAGTVAFADTFEGFGRLVIVDHGGSAFSLYGYLSSSRVAQGGAVVAGQVLGEVGEAPTGGTALYFELRVDGRPVDPLQWLERR